MEFDYKILEEKMQSLPEELKLLLTSPGIVDSVKKISENHGLKIDQESVLFDQISYVILGLTSSKDFVSNLSKEAKMDGALARVVSEDINKEIFAQVKSIMIAMQNTERIPEPKNTEKDKLSISSLERVGGFEVDKQSTDTEQNGVTSADKASILEGLENPQPTVPTMQGSGAQHNVPAPTNLPTGTPTWSKGQSSPSQQTQPSFASKPSPSTSSISQPITKPIQKTSTPITPAPTKEEQHTEQIVDFLMKNPAASPAQKVVSEPQQAKPATPPTPPRKSGPDPYREQI